MTGYPREHNNLQITLHHDRASLMLAQITDCHLGEKAGEPLLGMDTDASLAQVVALLKQQHPDIDLLLATGDLSNDGSEASYQRFAKHTLGLAPETLWLPGNHDTLAAMEAVFSPGGSLPRCAEIGDWQIVMLNSGVPGKVGGHLAEEELILLRRALEAGNNRHTLVCLHHHPIEIGCAWLDGQRVTNADALFRVLDDFNHVRGVLWGHIHQQVDTERNGVKLMATPSSCIQFAPGQQNFKLDRLNPGYRWLQLHSDGRIDTGIARIAHQFAIDYDYTGGYE